MPAIVYGNLTIVISFAFAFSRMGVSVRADGGDITAVEVGETILIAAGD